MFLAPPLAERSVRRGRLNNQGNLRVTKKRNSMSKKEDSSHGSSQALIGFKVPDALARVPDAREMGRARFFVRRSIIKFFLV
jgi:4-hydroxyphenylpyruvate dioxygenase-like putative hemolysin